jgi:hypothetical protein
LYFNCQQKKIAFIRTRKNFRHEWHLLNSYRRAIDSPTRVTSCGKRREYVRVGSTAASLPPTFPPEATPVGISKRHSFRHHYSIAGAGGCRVYLE